MDSAEKEGCGKSFSPESVICNKLRTNLVLCCLQFYVLVLSVLVLCLVQIVDVLFVRVIPYHFNQSFVMTLSDFDEIWYTCSVCGHKKTYKF